MQMKGDERRGEERITEDETPENIRKIQEDQK